MLHQKHFTKPNPLPQKIKYTPLALFPQGQDLPLFLGQPDQAADPWQPDPNPDPTPAAVQLSLFEAENDPFFIWEAEYKTPYCERCDKIGWEFCKCKKGAGRD